MIKGVVALSGEVEMFCHNPVRMLDATSNLNEPVTILTGSRALIPVVWLDAPVGCVSP